MPEAETIFYSGSEYVLLMILNLGLFFVSM